MVCVCVCVCACVCVRAHMCVCTCVYLCGKCDLHACHVYLLQRIFDDLFSEDEHVRRLKNGDVRFSYKALQGALMIFLYRCIYAALQISHCMGRIQKSNIIINLDKM